MVSATGTARIAAPLARAASTTRATAAGRTKGRAASCTATHSTSDASAASPARTESWRSAPPKTGAASFGIAASSGRQRSQRSRSARAITGTTRSIAGAAAIPASACQQQRPAGQRDEGLGHATVRGARRDRRRERERRRSWPARIAAAPRAHPFSEARNCLVKSGPTPVRRMRCCSARSRPLSLFAGLALPALRARAEDVPPPPPAPSPIAAPTLHGNLALSLQEAIAMGLENNLNLEVQRHAPLIADEDAEIAWGAYDPEFYGNVALHGQRDAERDRAHQLGQIRRPSLQGRRGQRRLPRPGSLARRDATTSRSTAAGSRPTARSRRSRRRCARS